MESSIVNQETILGGFDQYRICRIINDDGLEAAHAIDRVAYGPTGTPLQQLTTWWSQYPDGYFLLTIGGKVIGNFRLWPLSSNEAGRLSGGQVRTRDLEIIALDDIKAEPADHWYISGLAIEPVYRRAGRGNPLPWFLAHCVYLVMESGHLQFPMQIYGMAATPAGKRLLQRSGFRSIRQEGQTFEGYPLYGLLAKDRNQIAQRLMRYFEQMTV